MSEYRQKKNEENSKSYINFNQSITEELYGDGEKADYESNSMSPKQS